MFVVNNFLLKFISVLHMLIHKCQKSVCPSGGGGGRRSSSDGGSSGVSSGGSDSSNSDGGGGGSIKARDSRVDPNNTKIIIVPWYLLAV